VVLREYQEQLLTVLAAQEVLATLAFLQMQPLTQEPQVVQAEVEAVLEVTTQVHQVRVEQAVLARYFFITRRQNDI
jgi:hypothetical protein